MSKSLLRKNQKKERSRDEMAILEAHLPRKTSLPRSRVSLEKKGTATWILAT